MNRKIIILLVLVLIIGTAFVGSIYFIEKNAKKKGPEIKTDKETIYELFNNFPESKNIYYISENLHKERSVGSTIYQIDVLAELTDDSYNKFIKQAEFEDLDEFDLKVNPNKTKYNWKKIKNISIIKSKNNEKASINSMYLDENTKTIYIIALGGN